MSEEDPFKELQKVLEKSHIQTGEKSEAIVAISNNSGGFMTEGVKSANIKFDVINDNYWNNGIRILLPYHVTEKELIKPSEDIVYALVTYNKIFNCLTIKCFKMTNNCFIDGVFHINNFNYVGNLILTSYYFYYIETGEDVDLKILNLNYVNENPGYEMLKSNMKTIQSKGLMFETNKGKLFIDNINLEKIRTGLNRCLNNM
jgi:hypothetical protein